MPTRREHIVELLADGEWTVHALAEQLQLKVVDVLDDLEHVRRSLGRRLCVRPAECVACEFQFDQRARLGRPSRCPRCKHERTEGPWLSLKPAS